MNKPKVYLAGPMEGVSEEVWAWRDTLKSDEVLSEVVQFLDPTLRKTFHSQEYNANLCKKVVKTDLYDVDRADILFVNLKDRGEGKAWGSICELMYAYTKGKVVITILEEEFKHPFVEACSTVVCHNLEDATKELLDFVAWMV